MLHTAHVTHCHSLSLGVKDTTINSKILSEAMNTSREIVKLIKLSPKRQSILGEIKNNIEGDTEDQGLLNLLPQVGLYMLHVSKEFLKTAKPSWTLGAKSWKGISILKLKRVLKVAKNK